ncbi:MAG: hypothetical protein AB7D39_11315 [Pseudodesulfovibrio sp.]|uniref:hypothetical protein n=1 Tax=Pseudodesulfovibrio sp. TaxID=2035812 RepID=UPI003D097738
MRDFIFPQISRGGFLSVCDGFILTSREKNAQWAAWAFLQSGHSNRGLRIGGMRKTGKGKSGRFRTVPIGPVSGLRC